MLKTISLLLFITVCIHLNAQETDMAFAAARYSFVYVSDTTQRDNPLKQNMILYLGKNMSNYTDYDRIEQAAKRKEDGEKGISPGVKTMMNGKLVDPGTIDMSTVKSVTVNKESGTIIIEAEPAMALRNSYYKDQATSKLSFLDYAGKMFTVEEKIPVIDWSIKDETKTILGLQCQKAVADFKGRTYEAWFCSQLPYSNGPWKLGGLPGLILEAYDTRREVVFTFTSFENIDTAPVDISLPAGLVKATPKEFNQYREAIQNSRAATGGGGRTISIGSAVGGMISGDKPRQMNNPIEKEKGK
ncbi:MAG: GLPGLI family protein [Sediminibacterium sp.]